METKSPESAPTAQQGDIGTISIKDTAEQQGVQVTEQNPVGTVWDQAFYDTLTPEQQTIYKNADDATRTQMKGIIEVNRQLDQQGYQGDGDLTQEQVREAWSHIQVN